MPGMGGEIKKKVALDDHAVNGSQQFFIMDEMPKPRLNHRECHP
jgi:hypothetical protein